MSIQKLAEVVDLTLKEFLEMLPAPGHRDSEGRAMRAVHLHKLLPEHHEIEIAEYPTSDGKIVRESLTGNTRRQVWKCGLSDAVPEMVRARLYHMKDENEARERMLLHDSREAAWTAKDHKFRALDMTYGSEWHPRSKPLKSGAFTSAIRNVDCIVYHNRWTPDHTTKVELVMSHWKNEIKLLDQLLDISLVDVIKEKRPFTWGFLAACLLLLRFRPYPEVETFVHGILNDSGTKTDEGCDGIYIAVENLGKKGDKQDQIFRGIMGAFSAWEQRSSTTVAKTRKSDPLDWAKKQRNAERDATKARLIEAAE
jgi:hypothetical protein